MLGGFLDQDALRRRLLRTPGINPDAEVPDATGEFAPRLRGVGGDASASPAEQESQTPRLMKVGHPAFGNDSPAQEPQTATRLSAPSSQINAPDGGDTIKDDWTANPAPPAVRPAGRLSAPSDWHTPMTPPASPSLAPPVGNPSEIAPPRLSGRTTETSRVGVPVPRLPGEKGDPMAYTPERAAKHDYMMERIPLKTEQRTMSNGTPYDVQLERKPTGGERLKAALKGAGIGAVNALSSGTPGGMLGGAIAGGVTGAVSPKLGAEMQFNTFQRPRLQREQAEDNQRIAQQAAQEKAQQENEYRQAQTLKIYSDMDKDKLTTVAPGASVIGPDGKVRFQNAPRQAPRYVRGEVDGVPGFYDANDPALKGKIRPYDKPTTGRPQTLAEAEAARAQEEGTAEEIAQSSFNDPSRQESIKNKLTKEERGLLDGTIKPDKKQLPTDYQTILGDPHNATLLTRDPQMLIKAETAAENLIREHGKKVAAAERRLAQLKEQELNEIRRDTEQKARMKAGTRRSGGVKPAGGPTAKLSDLTKYLR